MVAVDENGDPVSVPEMEVAGDRGRQLLAAADCAP
jgi:hypothetical protein